MVKNVLILEDSKDSQLIIESTLKGLANLFFAKDIVTGINLLQTKKINVFIVDLILPDGSGQDFCKLIRAMNEYVNTPVLILTSRNAPEEKVISYTFGADNYLTKPFNPVELRAWVSGQLNRKNKQNSPNEKIFGDLKIALESKIVTVKNKVIHLTKIEFTILDYLMERPDTVKTREQILNAAWGNDTHVNNRSVDTHISKLRKRLGECGSYIHSSHGFGYCLRLPSKDSKAS